MRTAGIRRKTGYARRAGRVTSDECKEEGMGRCKKQMRGTWEREESKREPRHAQGGGSSEHAAVEKGIQCRWPAAPSVRSSGWVAEWARWVRRAGQRSWRLRRSELTS